MDSSTRIFEAYLFSVVIGVPLTWAWATGLHWIVATQFKKEGNHPERTWWVPMLLGIFERAIVTTLVIWIQPAVGAFMGAWIGVKAAGGWGRLQENTTRNRVIYLVGLLGSALSILWAVAWGIWVVAR